MKKTLIAAALVAGFAGVAQAESSVTLYGVVDAGLQVTTNKTQGTFGFTQGNVAGNRFGLKGSEDLGNGTSVIFNVEGGFNVTDGTSAQNGALFGRKAILGLADEDLGTLTAGLQKDAADALSVGDVVGAFDADDAFGTLQTRYLQALYVSPELAGFQFAASWGGNHAWGKSVATQSNDAAAVAVAYNLDELKLSLAYDWAKTNSDTLAESTKTKVGLKSQKEFTVGAEYDFGVLELGLRYQHYKAKAAKTKAKRFEIGFAVPVTDSGKVLTAFQVEKVRVDGAKTKNNLFRLAYLENLSKRSTAYVGYVRTQSKEDATKAKTKNNAFVVGLNHKF